MFIDIATPIILCLAAAPATQNEVMVKELLAHLAKRCRVRARSFVVFWAVSAQNVMTQTVTLCQSLGLYIASLQPQHTLEYGHNLICHGRSLLRRRRCLLAGELIAQLG